MFKKLERNDPCWCGSGRKYKKCHEAFDEKICKIQEEGHIVPGHELIKTPEQIAAIRESCAINIAVLDYVAEHIQAGISTEQIDQWVYQITTERGGIPAPLNYEGFPKSVCTSINEEVCHGIPSPDRILQELSLIHILLTKEGLRLHGEKEALIAQMNEELCGTLDPAETEQFLRTARKMKENIRKLLGRMGVRLGEEGCPEPPCSAGEQQDMQRSDRKECDRR